MALYYKLIKQLIAKGRTDGLEAKIEILWLDGKLTDIEREGLLALLPETTGTAV